MIVTLQDMLALLLIGFLTLFLRILTAVRRSCAKQKQQSFMFKKQISLKLQYSDVRFRSRSGYNKVSTSDKFSLTTLCFCIRAPSRLHLSWISKMLNLGSFSKKKIGNFLLTQHLFLLLNIN